MAWLRIDDTVPEHRKMLAAGHAAAWMWVCGIAYCQRQLTDGFIPALAIPMLGVTGADRAKKLAHVLVKVGLFEAVDGGYCVHDYHDHNATKDEALARKEAISLKRSEAGRRGARGRWQNGKPMANRWQPVIANRWPHPIPSHLRTPLPPLAGGLLGPSGREPKRFGRSAWAASMTHDARTLKPASWLSWLNSGPRRRRHEGLVSPPHGGCLRPVRRLHARR